MNYLLAILAAYRVARMLATEEGPLGIFETVRNRFDPEQATWLGRGLNCPLCCGFWASLLMAALLWNGRKRRLLLDWWGIAGGQSLLQLIKE